MMSGKSDFGKAGAPKGDIRWIRHAVFGMVCALVIGIFAWSAEPGFLELTSPHAENAYYNLLVQGFRAGQLNVKREASPGLTQLADPYDPAANASYIWDERYLSLDMSYYKEKLYLYFGVTPALVLFWPYVTLTGHYLLHKDAVVIFYALGFLFAAGLLRAVWRRYFPEVSVWVVVAGMLALGVATGILEVLSRCDVWEVAMGCGFAFTMLALAALWCALHEPKRQVLWLLMASLAYGLAIGSRPSLLFGVIILLMPVAQAWRAATELGSRRRVGLLLAAAVVPVVLIGLGLMLYNILRFDSPFEFGWHYQLATGYRQNTTQQFGLHYLWFNFRFYFLEPMRWSGHFPFLQAVPLSPLPLGYCGTEEPYGGILSNYPLVWLALAAPLAWRGRPVGVVSVLRWFVAAVFLLFVICALTICLYCFASSRYELDFLPALMLLAVMGIFGLERALVGSPVWRRIARWGWCLLLAYSVVFNLLAGVEAHAEASCFLGNSLLNQGRVDEAVEHFQKALALEPESATSHGGLGNALFQKGHMDEAIIQYQKALEIKPDFAEAHNNFAYSLLQIGRVDEAIIHYRKAIELQPESATFHSGLGNALFQKGQMDEAIIQYQKALVLQPKSADACERFGDALFRKGHMDEAIIQYQKALEIKPGFAEAHNNLGYCFLEIGRVDEAIVHYRKAIELQPRFVQAYNNLGNAFRQKRMAAEAMACFQKAIELQPQFIPALKNLVWMLATWPEPSVRNGGKAVALAGQANRFSKDKDPLVLRTLAAAYAEAGRFPEAVATAKQALALAVTQSNTGLTNVLQTEIGLYQTHSPRRSINAVDE
jgi:tetratricopeptide (TPR) repeat protein